MPKVVTCILQYKNKILILKRSNKVGTYKEMWGGVAGFVEENEEPYDTAIKEIKEEVGLDFKDIKLVKKGNYINFQDKYESKTYNWIIFPFLFELKENKIINLDWEHLEYKWIDPSNISHFKTVPRLKDVILELL